MGGTEITPAERVATLFDAIAHGDDEHRAWLKQAIDDHFAGREVERPRGSGTNKPGRQGGARGGRTVFDATDLEIARREHAYEMGVVDKSEAAWSRFYNAAKKAIIANGWDGKFNNGKSRGLDGNEYTADGEPSDGYSIDGAYEAWERGQKVETYIAGVAKRRAELGL